MSPTVRRGAPLSLLVMGSGGSAAVPDIACVTSPSTGCACCLDTLRSPHGSGENSPNKRGNTGAVIRVPPEVGKEREGEMTILLDCGKTFREQALRIFPEKGLRKIDAVILTHHHADAIDGLDDLRAWTYKTAIESTIPIYCSAVTYSFIRASFPYLISKAAASGGGAVPTFQWHVMPDDKDWEICGVKVTPLPVHHGRYFTTPPKPLICLGFLFDDSVLYMSDVNYIPESIWSLLSTRLSLPSPSGVFPSPSSLPSLSSSRPTVLRPSPSPSLPLPRLQALIIDCIGLSLGPSHFGLPQAILTARRLGAKRTYLTDFPHETSHDAWLAFCHAFERGKMSREGRKKARQNGSAGPPPLWRKVEEHERQSPASHVLEGLDARFEDLELFAERALEAVEDWAGGVGLEGGWVRPARDGMRIGWERDEGEGEVEETEGGGRVWDDEYDGEEEGRMRRFR
ncbi:hypothetical protein JCM8547_005321 [Rhodosporidiobolus lusitaniae]